LRSVDRDVKERRRRGEAEERRGRNEMGKKVTKIKPLFKEIVWLISCKLQSMHNI